MVRLADLHPEEAQGMRNAIARFAQFDLEPAPWLTPPPLADSKVALVTTAALHRRDDRPFRFGDHGYRLIPDGIDPGDLVQAHVSVNFDRTHYQRDHNVVLPIDRLHELAEQGEVGAVSEWHYSVQGASPNPAAFMQSGADIARRMLDSGVNSALLVPV